MEDTVTLECKHFRPDEWLSEYEWEMATMLTRALVESVREQAVSQRRPIRLESRRRRRRPQQTRVNVEMTRLEEAARKGDERTFLEAIKEIDWRTRPVSDFVRAIDLALEAGAHLAARQLSAAGAEVYSDNLELQKYARVLSPPKVIPTNVQASPNRGANLEWLKTHKGEYSSKWVALKDGQLLEVANTLKELVAKVGNPKGRGILLTQAY